MLTSRWVGVLATAAVLGIAACGTVLSLAIVPGQLFLTSDAGASWYQVSF